MGTPGVLPTPTSFPLVSSRIDVHPSMNDAMPLTMRSPLNRSTLSRAPVDQSQLKSSDETRCVDAWRSRERVMKTGGMIRDTKS